MKGSKLRIIVYSLIIILVLFISFIYRAEFYKSYSSYKKVSLPLKNKTIVRLWLKKSDVSPARKFQIEKFNKNNKDNIYIILTQYKQDYDNAIRTTLASGLNAPDIFQYGFKTLMQNNQIVSLDGINFDKSKVDNSNIVKYEDMPIGVKLTDTNVKMVWNKELFKEAGLDPEKPPKTWEEIIDYSLKIKKRFPQVTPFAFPMKESDDMKISLGEPSVNLGDIYTSFWNYKKGEYDFKYAYDILNVYNKMYKLNLIANNFDENSSKQISSQFCQGNVAMMISTFEDKKYFSDVVPIHFSMGIGDVVQIGKENKNIYYYIKNNDFLVINKESAKDEKKKEAIKKVYEYMLSEDVNKQILKTKNELPVNLKSTVFEGDKYAEYNDVSKFHSENYDPTLFLNRDSESYEIKLITDAIKGKSTINSSIEKLNQKYKYYCDFAVDKEKFDFNYYKK